MYTFALYCSTSQEWMRVAKLHSIIPTRNFLEFQDFLDGSCLDELPSSSEKSDPTPLCDPVRLCPQSFSAVAIETSRDLSNCPVESSPPTPLDLGIAIDRCLRI